jgi:hypothetical protein
MRKRNEPHAYALNRIFVKRLAIIYPDKQMCSYYKLTIKKTTAFELETSMLVGVFLWLGSLGVFWR